MGPRSLERLDIVAKPAFVTHFQDVCALDVGENVAPVVIVLDEITLRETNAISHALSSDADARDTEVTGLALKSLDAILRKDGFIQSRWTEVVRPVHLKGALNGVLGARKLWDNVRRVLMGEGAEETSVDAVLREVLVHANEILITVSKASRVEYSGVNHWSGARYERGRRSVASCRWVGAKDVRGRLQYAADCGLRRRVGIQDLGPKSVGKVSVSKCRKGRVWKSDCGVARRSGSTRGFYTEHKEELMVRNDGAADRSRKVVAMEGRVRVVRSRQGVLRIHLLIVEVVAGQTVELIGTRLGCLRDLEAAAAAVLHRKCVYLNVQFLDEIGVGGKVQNALPNGAGDIQSIDDPHIRDRALAIDADVYGLFGGEVVQARARSARSHARAAGQSEPRDAGCHADQREHIAACQRQIPQGLSLESGLISRVGGVHERIFRRDRHRFGRGTELYCNRHGQVLIAFQSDDGFDLGKTCRFHGDFVGTRAKAQKAKVAGAVGSSGRGNTRGHVDEHNSGLGNR